LICENVVPFVYLLLFVPQVKSYLVIGTGVVCANIDFVTKSGFFLKKKIAPVAKKIQIICSLREEYHDSRKECVSM
jgi:hypothetical protein